MTVRSQFADIIIPDDVSLPQFILDRLVDYGDAVALHDHLTGRQLTFQQVGRHARALAAALQARGLRVGAVVAVLLPNLPEYAVVMLGATLAGAVVTTVNPAYKTSELKHQLHDSQAQYLVTVPTLLAAVAETRHPLREVFVVGEAAGATPLASLIAGEDPPAPVPLRPREDVAVLPYSSGTTGLPKGVRLCHYNIVANILQVTANPEYFILRPGDTVIGLLPFFHIYGMSVVLFACIYHGICVVILPKFEKDSFLDALTVHKAAMIHIAPPLARLLAKHPDVAKYDLTSHLRDILSGAAPLGRELAEECVRRLGCPVRQGYGMTEMSPASHLSPYRSMKYASIGRLLPNMEMKIVDVETGEVVPPGQRGEMLLKGPNVMLGYHNNPEATAATLDLDGFLHTGDVAYQDEDGDCFIVDRCKELIKVKGFQVAPAELEDVLQGHPAVEDCGVVGIFVAGDEYPKAFVVLKAAHPPTDILKQELIEYAARLTASYKRLQEVAFVAAIPKAASGKILRRELREM